MSDAAPPPGTAGAPRPNAVAVQARVSRMRKWVLLGLGYGFLVLGVLGLFLPVLQGILFLAIGLVILSGQAPWAQRLRVRLGEKYPKVNDAMVEAEFRAKRWMDKIARKFTRG